MPVDFSPYSASMVTEENMIRRVEKSRRAPFVGTAGWAIQKAMRDEFFATGAVKPNHLKAYSERFTGIEINSSFYKDHQPATYAKWASATPEGFRFSIKLAKRFTHIQKLEVESSDLKKMIEGTQELGEKFGVFLIQLPPKLVFDSEVAETFFSTFRELFDGDIAVEARNQTWAGREATQILEEYSVARVIADPNRIGEAPPIRSAKLCYFRLHGSPKIYYSEYTKKQLEFWRAEFKKEMKAKQSGWCIFDNTALGAATANALEMLK